MKTANYWIAMTLGASLGVGCGDDGGDIDPPCLDNKCGGTDEAGEGDGDEDRHNFCTVAPGNGEKTVHQCDGELSVTLAFETLLGDCAKTLGDAAWCYETHRFGEADDYEMPLVMACCDAIGAPKDGLLDYCAMDLVEQVCRSIPARLQKLITGGTFRVNKIIEQQAKNLLGYLKNNQQECYDALHRPAAEPGVLEPGTWLVNNGDNSRWRALKRFRISLTDAAVESAFLPEDPAEHVACEDVWRNNGEIFEERGPLPVGVGIDSYRLQDTTKVLIRGPSLRGAGGIHGQASVVSESLCDPHRCSILEVGEDGDGRLVLQELELFAVGATSLTVGEISLEVDDLALRLYGSAQGYLQDSAAAEYIIAPGEAQFFVSGLLGAHPSHRWVVNSTPVVLGQALGGWTVEPFAVEYTDAAGAWTATIPRTLWD